jgi:hypothetical protein
MVWTNQDKIDVLRGILQLIGIMIMVACIVAVAKYRHVLFEDCGVKNINGVVEPTGLYGNCTWLDESNTRSDSWNQQPQPTR